MELDFEGKGNKQGQKAHVRTILGNQGAWSSRPSEPPWSGCWLPPDSPPHSPSLRSSATVPARFRELRNCVPPSGAFSPAMGPVALTSFREALGQGLCVSGLVAFTVIPLSKFALLCHPPPPDASCTGEGARSVQLPAELGASDKVHYRIWVVGTQLLLYNFFQPFYLKTYTNMLGKTIIYLYSKCHERGKVGS